MTGDFCFARSKAGFTLLELMVTMAIMLLLVVVLAAITNATQRTWAYTTGKVEQFRGAREAFESMTRRLSQATLNTYWDYHYPAGSTQPDRYMRQSELRFICGNLNAMTSTSTYTNFPSQAIFFQAPLGYVNNTSYSNLYNLLNTWGYFVEFGSDKAWYPSFISSLPNPPPQRYRFRLMEMMEPSESLTLYNSEAAVGNANYVSTDWFTTPLASTSDVQVVTDNIIALVLLPKLTPEEDSTGTTLSPNYSYNSVKTDANNDPIVSAATDWKNQLPPEVQVTMVAVDEASYKRFQGSSTTMPNLLVDSGGNPLFQQAGDLVNSSNPGYARDIQALQATLVKDKLNYRVFSTNVSLKAAKWSRDQTN